ncbi:MAG: TrbG/VirB9 family P-type conjugative transfer protein [Selenomonadaceae bacterium]|nr:TrbG/VirB9 family P-type conjugative transfer protein [Selenomonadaceae bacterium]
MSKNLRKMAMAMAIMATLFNQCDVQAAEPEKSVMQDEVRENKTSTTAEDKNKVEKHKDKLKKGDAKKINARLDELDEKFETQSATQRKILEMLERFETERVKGTSEVVSAYNPLINPSATQKIDYTQDAANSQDNSTVVFKYAPNQLYKIYCRVGYLTDLSLKKGETVTFVGGGDTSAWAVEKTTVDGVAHIYIKPTVDTSTTNLIITTNKRSYQLILNTSSWYNPMVTWTYGQEEQSVINLREEQGTISKINENVEFLNFNYKISGESRMKLVAVFDDGEKTILKFDKIPKRLPSLFIRSKGKIIMANYKIRENCYIVDRVAEEIELRVSDKEIIKIRNRK